MVSTDIRDVSKIKNDRFLRIIISRRNVLYRTLLRNPENCAWQPADRSVGGMTERLACSKDLEKEAFESRDTPNLFWPADGDMTLC